MHRYDPIEHCKWCNTNYDANKQSVHCPHSERAKPISGREEIAWQPIETAPRDGTFILLAGPSGYTSTPLRVEVARFVTDYAEKVEAWGWRNHANDSFLDGGGPPTFWLPLPNRD